MSEFKNKISLFHKRETRKQINMNHESLEYLFFFVDNRCEARKILVIKIKKNSQLKNPLSTKNLRERRINKLFT